jgi:hypothetical protein
MSRVRSDDNYSREESLEDQSPAAPTAKLGEGLPLLQRLRLLKEKQDREERGKQLLTPSSPPPVPGPLSPPALRLQPPQEKPQEEEVVGAGLPLIQRLLLLKQKEDRERLTMQATAVVAADVLANTVRMQQEDGQKSVHLTVSPPNTKVKGYLSDDSRHSSSSKEQSEDESSLASRKPSLLNRLVSITHKDTSSTSAVKQSSGSSLSVPSHQTSDTSSSSSAEPCVPATSKGPLLLDKLKLLTQKECVLPSSSSSTGTVISVPKVRAHSSAKSDSDSTSSAAVLKKQHSWSLLKKASILSSQNSNELSKESALTVPKPTSTHDPPVLSSQVQPSGISTTESKGEQNSNFTSAQTASADETKVITVCDNGDSELIPSKPSSALKVNEVSNGKSVSLFKQKVAKLTSEDQGQQSTISQSSKVQDMLKNEEIHVLAQLERKESEENNMTEKTADTSDEEVKEQISKYSKETATFVSATEQTVGQPSVKLMDSVESPSAETSKTSLQRRLPKPNLLRLQQGTKLYMSIDDLSPEYSGLPFVKKLKILNERQKLAELEQKVAHVLMRSSSLDSSNAVSGTSGCSGDSVDCLIDPMNLTRSHSDASAMQYVRLQQICKDSYSHTGSQTNGKDDDEEITAASPNRPRELPEFPATEASQSLTSPESNETLERRNLKSILKKLSASSLFSGSSEDTKQTVLIGEQPQPSSATDTTTVQPTAKPSNLDMHKLMRAQTVEGYAARHSKLTKSVTFNRDTLQSPPATATTPTKLSQEHSGSLFPLPVGSEDRTVNACQSTCITTCTTSVSTVITPSAGLSTSSSQYLTTTVLQHETLPPVTAPVTMAVTTTLHSVMSPSTISSTISSVSPLPIITSEPSQVPPANNLPEVSLDTTESAFKKKSHVSFIVQHPHQMPLSANDKNFFRPSLLLPSHMSLEEEYFNVVIAGIKKVIQGHLVSSAAAKKMLV